MEGISTVRDAVYQHPAMNSVDVENGEVVSVYQGVRISTGRKRPKGQKHGFGDLDPINSKLSALLAGTLDLAILDNEEIQYGIPRCDDGKFSAKAAWQAAMLPVKAKSLINKELYRRATYKLHSGLLPAIDSIVELASSPHVEDQVRLKAATYLFERLQGKTPDVVHHVQEAPWEIVLSGVKRGPRPVKSERLLEDGNTEEAEVVDDQPWRNQVPE